MCFQLQTKQGRLRFAKVLLSFSLLGIACVISARKVNVSKATISDYAAYWSASRLLLDGQNPYDAEKVFAVQKAVGWAPSALVMRNPPWTFALVLPFGLVAYKFSRILWTILQVLIVLGCASWLWKQYSRSSSTRWVAAIITATLFPALWVLVMGQITPFILLGLVGFLYCETSDRTNSWLQAASLVLIGLKPQLLYLFWVALGLSACWALRNLDCTTRELRRWTLFRRFAILLLATSAIPLAIDPHVFSQYFSYLRNTPILLEAIPTPGNFLRIHTNMRWTQFAPMALGSLWLYYYWRKNRDQWQWSHQMPLLLLVSLATTTYGWFYDQVLLLPVILFAAAQNFPALNKKRAAAVIVSYLTVNVGIATLFQSCQRLSDFRMLWTMPIWCSLYAGLLWMSRVAKRTRDEQLHEQVEDVAAAVYAANLVA
ncbi:MAG: hypothetical protein JWO13_1625 [Acidobacteriales bacterium]|nr:hypothetical protein [Terriglobales bacterium]